MSDPLGPYGQIYGQVDASGNEQSGTTAAAQIADKQKKLLGVTQAPGTTPPEVHSSSDGQGFFDRLKASAAQNIEKAYDYVAGKPQPAALPDAQGFAGKAGDFAAGLVDPVNLVGFGAAGAASHALGVPALAEKLGLKFAGEGIANKLTQKAVQYGTEGAVTGAMGQPASEALRAHEDGGSYDLSRLPGDVATGAAFGAVADPLIRSVIPAAQVGVEAIKGAFPAPGAPRARASVFDGVPHGDAAHVDNFDPWDLQRTPIHADANIGMGDKSIPDLEAAGKLAIRAATDKATGKVKFGDFGDRMDVETPVDPEWLKNEMVTKHGYEPDIAAEKSVQSGGFIDEQGNWNSEVAKPHVAKTDIHITGFEGDKTLHVGWLRHSSGFPGAFQLDHNGEFQRVRDPASSEHQPIPTPRETAMTMRVIQDQLIRNPDIKWLDTEPINSHVMKQLAKYGGRFEGHGGTMVVDADNIRNGTKVGIHPETAGIMKVKSAWHTDGETFVDTLPPEEQAAVRAFQGNGMDNDPTGRVGRAFEKLPESQAAHAFATRDHLEWQANGAEDELGDFGEPEGFSRDDIIPDHYSPYDDIDQGEGHDIGRDSDGNLAYSVMPGGPPIPTPEGIRRGASRAKAKLDEILAERKTEPVINVKKMGLSKEATARIEKAAEVARPILEANRSNRGDMRDGAEVLSKIYADHYTPLDYEAARKLSGPEARARELAIAQLDTEINATGKEMDAAEGTRDAVPLAAKYDKLVETQNQIFGDLTVSKSEIGRNLNALRHAPDSLAGWLHKARNAAGLEPGTPLPIDVETEIRRAHGKGKEAANPQEKALTQKQLEDLIEGLKNRPWWAHAVDLYKTAITMPGPIDAANAIGNTVQQLAEESSHAVGSFADVMVKMAADALGKEGKRTLSYTQEGGGKGLAAGHEDASQIMKTGLSAHAAGKFGAAVGEHFTLAEKLFEDSQAAVKTDKFLQAYMHYHWRRFGAADAYFREYRFARSLAAEARVQAMNEGASDVHARASEILKDPSAYPTMAYNAMEDALRSTFNKENSFASGIHAFTAKQGGALNVAANMTVPFVRTVANVAEAMIDYTPVVGAIKEIAGGALKNQREAVLALGRQVTGSGVVAAAYVLAKAGLITGAGPQDTAGKQQWEAQGKIPWAFKSPDGTWRDYNRALGPIALPMGLAAQYAEMENDDRQGPGHSFGDKVNTFASGSLSQLADQVPGGSLTQLSSHKESSSGQMIADIAKNDAMNVIPGTIANVAKGLDDKERATDTFLDRLKARIPGVRETLPAKVDATGQEIPRAEGLLPTLFDPTNPHADRTNPVLDEMARLQINYAKPASTGTYLPQEQMERFKAGATRNIIPEKYDRQPADVRAISEAAGPETMATLGRLMQQPNYTQMPDEVKRIMVQQIVSQFRMKATIQHEVANPQQVTPPPTWP